MRVLAGAVLRRVLTTRDRRRWSSTARTASSLILVNSTFASQQPVQQRVALTTQRQQQQQPPSGDRGITGSGQSIATAAFHHEAAQRTQPAVTAAHHAHNLQVSAPIFTAAIRHPCDRHTARQTLHNNNNSTLTVVLRTATRQPCFLAPVEMPFL